MTRKGKLTIASSSSSSSSSSFGDTTKTRNRHKVTESAYDNEFEIEPQITSSIKVNTNSSTSTMDSPIGTDNIDSKKSIKSILRSIVLKVHRRESEDMAARIVNDMIPLPFLKSLIQFRLAYETKTKSEESKGINYEGIYPLEDKAVQGCSAFLLLKSRLVGVELESASKEQLQNILKDAVTEDLFSVEAADAETNVEKLAAIDNITTEDIERHFEQVSTSTTEIYKMLLERYGKGIDEYQVLSAQNDSFSKYAVYCLCMVMINSL